MSIRIVGYVAVMGVCLSFLVAGCQPGAAEIAKPTIEKPTEKKPPAEPAVNLALGFRQQDSAKYKVIMETDKGYKFDQPTKGKIVEEHTSSTLEMRFTQEIESIDKQGSAIAKITVEGLRYLAQVKNDVKWDFDSSRDSNSDNALAKLIGQSYKIRIRPDGKASVVDAGQINAAVKGGSAEKLAKGLFSAEVIEKRHSVPALPDSDKSRVQKGRSWSRIKASPQGMLEPKSYEKIYTLDDVERRNGRRVAVVKMTAAPSLEPAEDMPKVDKGMGIFAKMFDSSDTYEGSLLLNLDSGQVAEYSEVLEAKWAVAEEPAGQETTTGPDVLTMTFKSLHSIEMID